jgi:hypothetical protein
MFCVFIKSSSENISTYKTKLSISIPGGITILSKINDSYGIYYFHCKLPAYIVAFNTNLF